MRRYVVVGAGAIGGTIGGVLAQAGVPVVLVARGLHGEVLMRQGLTIRTPDGVFQVPVQAVFTPDEVTLTDQDVLVFATKTQQLDAALRDWVDRPVTRASGGTSTAAETLPVLTALNGVTAEELALRYFRRVYGVCVWLPAVHLEPGEVIIRSWPLVGQFHMARWPSTIGTPDDAVLLSQIARSWTDAGIRVALPNDVAPWKYNKLLTNLGNVVGALLGDDRAGASVGAAARYEGQEVLRYAGIDAVPFEVSDAARADGPHPREVPGLAAGATNSTWQSLRRQTGDAETDYLNGEIVRIAHRCGLAAPVNSVLAALGRRAVRKQAEPGWCSTAELTALIEAARRG
ncbi:2-dehydropantoate 2-reductase N-terminal domain-containing protein [Mycobacterium sp. OTB74]|uniref:ketopantoate reductase family protein n=1 Tax=Mycobacterium sp. OTB74 TaxID=1853452 RepID=UPI002473E8E6|nr:2-dehydropantoate 2-reductase N-terminal domain-containing protein [Mycobacterium sp. OTB74]MDH6247356.1 2-dehydropantoate 2-reductase [Mycobacterium sp. OTB74]